MLNDGAVKLPSVKDAIWRKETYKDCLEAMGNKSYGENLDPNLRFLKNTNILSSLLPKLVEISQEKMGVTVDSSDIYNVCRLVRPGDKAEGYRGHFDSHLFTLVTPINIPNFENIKDAGQLHYYPYARLRPTSEIKNVIGKMSYKRFNTQKGFDKLALKKKRIIEDFQDYCPLLFLGNTTFHGNSPVQFNSTENRMTILTHFFDPSPKYGIGNMMRKIRSR